MTICPQITQISSRVQRYTLEQQGRPLTFVDLIDRWSFDPAFCCEFTKLLAASPFSAFRWEMPALTPTSRLAPAEFVVIDTPAFARRRSDRQTFAEKFDSARNEGVVAFANLSGDAQMVVPSPLAPADDFGHIAAFLRTATTAQTNAFWRTIGGLMSQYTGDPPVWLNTAGGGVAWLHVRLDSRPKYYHHTPYRTTVVR
ncbi:MAG: hypothetical protein NXI04_10305 [Planctomycetaceae bacterium]|nr:hypothetical protein [Planctomycetaceae bacterium]